MIMIALALIQSKLLRIFGFFVKFWYFSAGAVLFFMVKVDFQHLAWHFLRARGRARVIATYGIFSTSKFEISRPLVTLTCFLFIS